MGGGLEMIAAHGDPFMGDGCSEATLLGEIHRMSVQTTHGAVARGRRGPKRVPWQTGAPLTGNGRAADGGQNAAPWATRVLYGCRRATQSARERPSCIECANDTQMRPGSLSRTLPSNSATVEMKPWKDLGRKFQRTC